jgi:CheY-like chemotaxis protein
MNEKFRRNYKVKGKILVIEDDYNIKENICYILEQEGYSVESANDGLKGIEKVSSFKPDLILCDIMMPEKNGYEVLEEILNNPVTASIPLIFLTAKVEPENLRKGMSLGADDYIFKPFHINDLITSVETRIKKSKNHSKKINDMQEQIIAKVPHELRTPLVPILGYSEMIIEEECPVQIREMAQVINKYGKTLHGRIEKLLLYKELILIQHNDSHKHTFIDNDLVSYLITQLDPQLQPKERIEIEIETGTVLLSEADLCTIIKELLENALKFSGIDNHVGIKGYYEQDTYKVIVTDNGRGMTIDEINSITLFKKFGKVQLTEPGIGLGLAIVTKIVELNNCSFKITSELNKYTTCEITIPIKCNL